MTFRDAPQQGDTAASAERSGNRSDSLNLSRLVIAVAVGLICLQVAAGYLLISLHRADLGLRSQQEVDGLVQLVASSLRQSVWDLDANAATAIIGTFAADPRFIAIEVVSDMADGVRVGGGSTDGPTGIIESTAPIIYGDEVIGSVRARIDPGELTAVAGGAWLYPVVVIGLQLLFSVGAVWLLIRLAMRLAHQQTVYAVNRELKAEIKAREKYSQALQENEQQLRDVLNALPTSVFYVDSQNRIQVVNRVFCEWWNKTEAEVVGKTYRELFGAARSRIFEENMRRPLAGEALSLQATLTFVDGREREVDIVHVPDFASTGTVRGVFVVSADMTEQNRINRELASSRRLLQQTIDAAPVAITIKDRQSRYVYANRTALDKFALPAERVIGHTLVEAKAFSEMQGYLDTVTSDDNAVFESGKAHPLTAVATRRQGAWRDTLVSKTPILNADGEVGHIVTVSVDVTEMKDVEARALALKEEAELANAAKSMFLANMSHELRTPLNAIIGFSEIMMSEAFGPLGNGKYVEYARDIHHSGDHLHAIITDLLDVARIEVGAIELDLAAVDLAAVLNESCTMLRRKADKAGVTLVEAFETGLPTVMGDAVRLRQIFINLLDNAIKFTERGGSIVISSATPQPGTIAVTVADTGVGIDSGDIERVVEPFVHLPSRTVLNVSGTGLGLSLVKSLSELHGGAISIDSEPGRGTSVTVTLPCAGAPVVAIGHRRTA